MQSISTDGKSEMFVRDGSIVRRIWGRSDTILFVFAGASAEFALNKAVDWLYFTGRLPADPMGRLFSTVEYAQRIVFATTTNAHAAIDKITAIHTGVEKARGSKIPDWAYRDVLFMLIHYSIAAYEVLQRKLSHTEKEELFDVFYRMGVRMNICGLPTTYREWQTMREEHLHTNLCRGDLSIDLYSKYRSQLGYLRFKLLIETQKILVPLYVRRLLSFGKVEWAHFFLAVYKISRIVKLSGLLLMLLLPAKYRHQVKQLDRVPT